MGQALAYRVRVRPAQVLDDGLPQLVQDEAFLHADHLWMHTWAVGKLIRFSNRGQHAWMKEIIQAGRESRAYEYHTYV